MDHQQDKARKEGSNGPVPEDDNNNLLSETYADTWTGWWPWMKANFIPLHLVLGYIFVASGLVACFLMLLTWIFIWPWNKTLYRKMVMNLAYSHWSQFTFLGQWWSGSNCTVHMDNIEDLTKVGKTHAVSLMNHKYDIDWLMSWILAERLGILGGTKVYGKSSLKMVPLIGWAWMFTESIFLKRDWDKDKKIISRDLDHIREYPDGYWITLLLFCEGTRFTADKHKTSMEVARKKGLPELKHHLLPRTRGFVHSVHGFKGKVPGILDMTVGFRKDGAAPNLMNIVRGRPCNGEMFVRHIALDSVPSETDAECAEWVQELFQEKDKVYDDFHRNGHYTRGTTVNLPRRFTDLLMWMTWAVILCVPLFYYLGILLITGSWTLILTLTVLTVLFVLGVRGMIAVSEISSHSSAYGDNKKKSS